MSADTPLTHEQRVTPHTYVPWPGNHRWRTCQICGRGANADLHRTSTEKTAP